MSRLRLFLLQLFCSHRFTPDGYMGSLEGRVVRKVCVRCRALSFEYQRGRR